jgi:hypothetical protein
MFTGFGDGRIDEEAVRRRLVYCHRGTCQITHTRKHNFLNTSPLKGRYDEKFSAMSGMHATHFFAMRHFPTSL